MLAWAKEPAPFPSAFDGSELLGIEVLEEHARRLAAALTLSVGRHGTRSRHLRRLDENDACAASCIARCLRTRVVGLTGTAAAALLLHRRSS
jgi:hypothetical protein